MAAATHCCSANASITIRNSTAVQPDVLPGVAPIAEMGRWGYVAGAGAMANVTLHTAAKINYQTPPGAVQLDDRVCAFGSGHPGGANFTFTDGSARFVAEDLPLEQLQALSTRAGEEVVETHVIT